MFATRRLLQSCRITFFTRETCGLCTQAKGVLSDVWDKRPFEYKEVNVEKPEAKAWRDLYDFDVPVVRNISVELGRDIVRADPIDRSILARLLPMRRTQPSLGKP